MSSSSVNLIGRDWSILALDLFTLAQMCYYISDYIVGELGCFVPLRVYVQYFRLGGAGDTFDHPNKYLCYAIECVTIHGVISTN